MLIFITGYMASGKTTLGKQLAASLDYHFIDLDDLIEKSTGSTIADYFKQFGEDSFRKKEREILLDCLYEDRTVIATGGGTACYADNMDIMNEKGITVYIDTPVETILQRLRSEIQYRPLLKDIPGEQLTGFVCSHLAARADFYNRAMIRFAGEDSEKLADVVRFRLGAER